MYFSSRCVSRSRPSGSWRPRRPQRTPDRRPRPPLGVAVQLLPNAQVRFSSRRFSKPKRGALHPLTHPPCRSRRCRGTRRSGRPLRRAGSAGTERGRRGRARGSPPRGSAGARWGRLLAAVRGVLDRPDALRGDEGVGAHRLGVSVGNVARGCLTGTPPSSRSSASGSGASSCATRRRWRRWQHWQVSPARVHRAARGKFQGGRRLPVPCRSQGAGGPPRPGDEQRTQAGHEQHHPRAVEKGPCFGRHRGEGDGGQLRRLGGGFPGRVEAPWRRFGPGSGWERAGRQQQCRRRTTDAR